MSTKHLKKSLLAATCLSALSVGTAQSATINEGSGDFGNTFSAATALPSDTMTVIGQLVEGDPNDFFQIAGLTPGAVFSATSIVEGSINVAAFSTSTSATPIPLNGRTPSAVDLLVGTDGALTFGLFTEGDGFYQLNLTPVSTPNNSVPVAPTAALIGVGAAAAGLRRRKHGKTDK
jgi:hypothetical protein